MMTNKKPYVSFWIVGITLIIGLSLSILSWLELCVEHCSANHDYRLLGLPFAVVGLFFFTGLVIAHFLSRFYPFLSPWVQWAIIAGLGAEIMFIWMQKYQIGQWCPVCLGIAASLAIASLALSLRYFKSLYLYIQQGHRSAVISKIKKGLIAVLFGLIGFLTAFFGVTKTDFAQAAVNDMKERMTLGTLGSPIEVYVVTDWFCPSCRRMEPEFEELLAKAKTQAAFYFIDYAIHTNSLNFSPYNLAFLINNKPQYLAARRALLDLTQKTESPSDEEILAIAEKANVSFKELSFIDVKAGLDYFDKIVQDYGLSATPTVIITNIKTKKITKLEGKDEITIDKVLQAIESLN